MTEQNQEIVVGMDFSEPANRALSKAIELAKALGCPIRLVHAYDIPRIPSGNTAEVEKAFTTWLAKNSKEQLDDVVAKHNSSGIELRAQMVAGDAASEIVQIAEKHGAQLIVVGTKGHHAAYRVLLGSVADRVIRISKIPVLIVH